MKNFINKNKLLISAVLLNIVLFLINESIGRCSLKFVQSNLLQFIFILTPVFICVGLLAVWVDRNRMIKIMGEKSGIPGFFISFLLGIVTAVPLYALLPIAGVLLKKKSKISNVLIFICSSATIRIPLLLFESSSFGIIYTALRLIINILVVIIISYTINFILSSKDKERIYDNAENL